MAAVRLQLRPLVLQRTLGVSMLIHSPHSREHVLSVVMLHTFVVAVSISYVFMP